MSILSNNKPVAHLGRSSFDLSSTHAFSMRPAVLRPVIVQDTVPDSAFEINCADLVRTTALQRAAFLRGKHELDFFFVPYNLVYSRFNDIVLERGDIHSPAVEELEKVMPMLPLEHLYYSASLSYFYMLLLRRSASLSNEPFYTVFRAFNHAFSDETIPVDSDTGQSKFSRQFLYNEVDLVNAGNLSIDDLSFIGYDVLAMLDTLGYGNFGSTVYDLGSRVLESFTSLTDWTVISTLRSRINILIREVFRNPDFIPSSVTSATKFVNGLRLFCYHKVFYDRYRDEVFDINPVYPYAFSADYDVNSIRYGVTAAASYSDNFLPLLTILRPHLRTVKKDLVSGLFPSSQFDATAQLSDVSTYGEELGLSDRGTFSAYGVRFSLALQKYRETLLRAGSRSKDVLKAMFGVESRYINDTYVQYLGSFSGQLDLNKVSATAETGSYSVGDLAANVFSSISGDTINFTCNDFGVIIGVMSFFPELLHNNYGLSPHVLKSEPLHYFKEQFEDLGLQNVPSTVVSLTGQGTFQDFTKIRTLGYSARYYEYKTNLDFAHDQFGSAPLGYLDDSVVVPHPVDGFNSNYVVTRGTLFDVSLSTLRNYLQPNCMDSLFVSLDTGDINSYHFDVILDCQINAVLPMSQLGLPY